MGFLRKHLKLKEKELEIKDKQTQLLFQVINTLAELCEKLIISQSTDNTDND